jgi:spore coat polysaccharide biosynthesis protein SpsF
MLNKKVIVIIQARMGSTRLPGKVMEKIGDKPILEILVNRLKKSKFLDDIVIATTNNQNDDVIERLSHEMSLNCYRGSEEDVLERYVESSEVFNADVIVRVTADNPFTDTDLVDELIDAHLKNSVDYTYCLDTPLGVSAEIINSNVLKDISLKSDIPSEREHVTTYINSHPENYKILNFISNIKNQNFRLTVDTEEDLKLIKLIYHYLGDLENLKINEIINFLKTNPECLQINAHIKQKLDNLDTIQNIAFITDGSSKMGMGHVYRSLTFAKGLRKNLGAKAYFLTKSNENIIKKIEDENFPTIKLKNDNEIVDYLEKLDIKAIIIDNVYFKERVLKEIKERVNAKIVIVDNLNPINDKYADIVLNNLVRSNFNNKTFFDKNINTMYFCGPKYLILRDEFNISRKKKKNLKPKIDDILLIFGGSDPSNLTSRVLEKLNNKVTVNVVLGPEFKHFDDLDKILKKHKNKNVKIYNKPENIAELMYKADLAITSPGISMFEALFVGTPVLVIFQNPLQDHYYCSLDYEYLLKKSDIANLEHFLQDISSLTKRNEIIESFKKMDIGLGNDDVITYLSQMIIAEDVDNHVQKIKNEYENHLIKHDINSPEAVHYKDMKKGNLRFKISTDIDNLNNKKILDFGCGNALLLDFLNSNGINCEYYGWDISEKMIEAAKNRHPNGNFKVVDVINDDLSKFTNFFDFIIISGVYNGNWDNKHESIHKKWINETLLKLWPLCKKGISSNFLTEYVEWEEKGLYYCKLDEMISFVVNNLSRWFTLRQDYNLFEFTMYIYKEGINFTLDSNDLEIVNLNSTASVELLEQYVKLRNKYKDTLNSSIITLEGTKKWLEQNSAYLRGIVKQKMLIGVIIIYINKNYELTFFSKEIGMGVGKFLLNIADDIAEEKKIKKLWAWTSINNFPSIKSLEKNGWKVISQTKNKIYFEKVYEENK